MRGIMMACTKRKAMILPAVVWLGFMVYLWLPQIIPTVRQKDSIEKGIYRKEALEQKKNVNLTDAIHVCIMSDKKTIGGMMALVNSIRINTKHNVMFHLFVERSSIDQARLWVETSKLLRINYEIRIFPSELVKGKIKVRGDRPELASPLNFGRYYLPQLLPNIHGRVLYIDDDSIVQEPPCTDTIVDPPCRAPCTYTIVKPPCTNTILEPPCTNTIVEPPCTDTIVEPPCTDTIVDLPCTDTIVDLPYPPCTDTIVDLPCTDTIVDPPCNDTIVDPPCTDTIVDLPCTDTIVDIPCTDTIVDLPCRAPCTDTIVEPPYPPCTDTILDLPCTDTNVDSPFSAPCTDTIVEPPCTDTIVDLSCTDTIVEPPCRAHCTDIIVEPPCYDTIAEPPCWTTRTSYSDSFLSYAKLLHWNGHYKPWGGKSSHSVIWDRYYVEDPTGKFHPVRKN
ncbi:glycosyltransferase 8 domain-containing protein 2-like [Argopecten irradians]|uniref:glycosyltransferase 8 domain-containing protein 2-like n=1 Tax=Argopecten irradians TaxID=31199 RepID=UPI00371376F7